MKDRDIVYMPCISLLCLVARHMCKTIMMLELKMSCIFYAQIKVGVKAVGIGSGHACYVLTDGSVKVGIFSNFSMFPC
jgi:hypothetical protein